MRKSDEPLTDTLVRCLADPMDLKGLERLENDGDQAGARLMPPASPTRPHSGSTPRWRTTGRACAGSWAATGHGPRTRS